MPPLTRRRDPDVAQETWRIYYGDVHAGTIAQCVGNPGAAPKWQWRCGFYPGSRPGECTAGTAETFDQARSAFERAWAVFLSRRTEADFLAWREHRAWTAEKYRCFDRGERMSPVPPPRLTGSDLPGFMVPADRFQTRAVMKFRLLGVVASLMTISISAADAGTTPERCEISKAGIKRCEKNIGSEMKTISYSNSAHELVDVEISFTQKIDAVYPIALIGSTMAILAPKSTKEERRALFERLIANAARGKFDFVSFGNYEWISSKTDTTIMIRASRKAN